MKSVYFFIFVFEVDLVDLDLLSTSSFFTSPGDGGYARDARLKAPSSLAVAPNGTLYIADLGNIRIRAVSPNQPHPSPAGLVEISSPLDHELYLFSQVHRTICSPLLSVKPLDREP